MGIWPWEMMRTQHVRCILKVKCCERDSLPESFSAVLQQEKQPGRRCLLWTNVPILIGHFPGSEQQNIITKSCNFHFPSIIFYHKWHKVVELLGFSERRKSNLKKERYKFLPHQWSTLYYYSYSWSHHEGFGDIKRHFYFPSHPFYHYLSSFYRLASWWVDTKLQPAHQNVGAHWKKGK